MKKITILLFTVTAFLTTNLLPGDMNRRGSGGVVVSESPTSELVGMFDRTGLRSAPSGQDVRIGMGSPVFFVDEDCPPVSPRKRRRGPLGRSSTSLGDYRLQAWTVSEPNRIVLARTLADIAMAAVNRGETAANGLLKLKMWPAIKEEGVSLEAQLKVQETIDLLTSRALEEVQQASSVDRALDFYDKFLPVQKLLDEVGLDSSALLDQLREVLGSKVQDAFQGKNSLRERDVDFFNAWEDIRYANNTDVRPLVVQVLRSQVANALDLNEIGHVSQLVASLHARQKGELFEKGKLVAEASKRKKLLEEDARLFQSVLSGASLLDADNSDMVQSLIRSVGSKRRNLRELETLRTTLDKSAMRESSSENELSACIQRRCGALEAQALQHARDSNRAVEFLGLFPGQQRPLSNPESNKRKVDVALSSNPGWDGGCGGSTN
ncbi:hypothetical protein HOM50_05275 [bacterium]|nr:hypothetical protein [bacterium]MBT5015793.1 hypothetical protein [bacterium]